MKKLIYILFIIMLSVLVIGCSGDAADSDDSAELTVDVDLTELSSIMAQAEFFNILFNRDEYIGKVIRVRGPYYSFFFAPVDRHIHYVMIVEGDECCRMGMEFKRSGGYIFPDDYPEQYTVIEIVGVLGSYEEMGSTFVYLAIDEIIFVN